MKNINSARRTNVLIGPEQPEQETEWRSVKHLNKF